MNGNFEKYFSSDFNFTKPFFQQIKLYEKKEKKMCAKTEGLCAIWG